jgi:hypothetical protein
LSLTTTSAQWESVLVVRLSDRQLEAVVAAAGPLPVEKRGTFLQRVAVELERVRHPGDRDVERAAAAALRGLTHKPAA